MLADCELIGFIPTLDAKRARRFYVETLQLQFVEDNGFAVVVRANRTTIRIARVDTLSPAPFTVLGWEVDGIEAVVQTLTAAGVKFVRYPSLEQDAGGIWTVGKDKVAWFHDPDGNLLSVSQHGSGHDSDQA